MSSEPNLYRTENYQNYINSLYKKKKVEKSISDVKAAKIDVCDDDDSDSTNSIAESLNNYLDIKVCVFVPWAPFKWCHDNKNFLSIQQVIDDHEPPTQRIPVPVPKPEPEPEIEPEAEPMFR